MAKRLRTAIIESIQSSAVELRTPDGKPMSLVEMANDRRLSWLVEDKPALAAELPEAPALEHSVEGEDDGAEEVDLEKIVELYPRMGWAQNDLEEARALLED